MLSRNSTRFVSLTNFTADSNFLPLETMKTSYLILWYVARMLAPANCHSFSLSATKDLFQKLLCYQTESLSSRVLCHGLAFCTLASVT
mmetsp:Transcript_1949/g.2606  ORF Transcript_1949/g.2606 Transcript_1949/m.2606 type:complete len:88 (+) Transcript_1949:118-381(+)